MKYAIEKKLYQAVRQDTPDCFKDIWERSNSMEHTSEELNNIENRPSFMKRCQRLITGTACVCAAALVLFLGLTAAIDRQVQAIVGLDVNPSIELSVGRSDKVVKIDAVNDDAREIIGNMKLKGTHIDVAVNAIVGAMVQGHYLDNDMGTVLVSVAGKDSAKVDTLKSRITTDVKNILTEHNIKGEIMNQIIPASKDPQLKSVAEKYGISLGKAAFLQKLSQNYPEYPLDLLAPMNMHELYSLIRKNQLDLTGIVDIDDDDDDIMDEIEDFIEDIDETVKKPVNNGSGQSQSGSGTGSGNTSQNARPSGNNDGRGDRYDDNDDDDDRHDDRDDDDDDDDDRHDDNDDRHDDGDDDDDDDDDNDFDDYDDDDDHDDDDDNDDDSEKPGSSNIKFPNNSAAGNQNSTAPGDSNPTSNRGNDDDNNNDSDDDDDDHDDDDDDDDDDENDDHAMKTESELKKEKIPENTSAKAPASSDEYKAGNNADSNTSQIQGDHHDNKDRDDDDLSDDSDDDDDDRDDD